MATLHDRFAAKSTKRVASQIRTWKCETIPIWHCECLSYLRSESTVTTNLGLQQGGINIRLDRTILHLHCVFISFTSFCPWWLVLAWSVLRDFILVWHHSVPSHQQNVFLSLGAAGSVWELPDQNPRVVRFQSLLDRCSGLQVHRGAPVNNLCVHRRSGDN